MLFRSRSKWDTNSFSAAFQSVRQEKAKVAKAVYTILQSCMFGAWGVYAMDGVGHSLGSHVVLGSGRSLRYRKLTRKFRVQSRVEACMEEHGFTPAPFPHRRARRGKKAHFLSDHVECHVRVNLTWRFMSTETSHSSGKVRPLTRGGGGCYRINRSRMCFSCPPPLPTLKFPSSPPQYMLPHNLASSTVLDPAGINLVVDATGAAEYVQTIGGQLEGE